MNDAYCQCTDCQSIYRRANLPREYVGDNIMRAYCPVDLCEQFHDVNQPVCEYCEKRLAEPDDDYCKHCQAIVDAEEADFRLDLGAVVAEQPDDLTEAVFDIANPWRKAS